jgi:signal transduction histidine kinase
MDAQAIYARFQTLQAYAGWTEGCARRIVEAADLLRPKIPELVEDFYAEIARHPETMRALSGGMQQIERLKGTLVRWLEELIGGEYGPEYVARRWRVGWRHVEIGLDQAFTNVAMSRLRSGLFSALHRGWAGAPEGLLETCLALGRAIDLDLALIEDAYQSEYMSRLTATERLAAIGQVAGGIAHELRNPLNVIKTSVYYLLNTRAPSTEKQMEHLQRIERQVGLANAVITSLSNFARMPVPDLQPIQVAAWLAEVMKDHPPPASCQVKLQLPQSLPRALGDPEQLRIALSNLVRNAYEAMPEGGTLTISAREWQGKLEILVSDTGRGMSGDTLSRVMEPLFSTKARGLGLGLSIARSIVEKNKGALRGESTPGQGSTFTLTLQSEVAGDRA